MKNYQKKILGTVLACILILVWNFGGFGSKSAEQTQSNNSGSSTEIAVSQETDSNETTSVESSSAETETESTESVSTETVGEAVESTSAETETESTESVSTETEDDSAESAATGTESSEADGLDSYTDDSLTVTEDGEYISREEVALYLSIYNHLPSNYITKNEAKNLGWESSKGNLQDVAPGKSIGGDTFGNREGKLPTKKGRKYYECDINYTGGYRGSDRIIYSNDGLVYYTGDHYNTFELLYGEE